MTSAKVTEWIIRHIPNNEILGMRSKSDLRAYIENTLDDSHGRLKKYINGSTDWYGYPDASGNTLQETVKDVAQTEANAASSENELNNALDLAKGFRFDDIVNEIEEKLKAINFVDDITGKGFDEIKNLEPPKKEVNYWEGQVYNSARREIRDKYQSGDTRGLEDLMGQIRDTKLPTGDKNELISEIENDIERLEK